MGTRSTGIRLAGCVAALAMLNSVCSAPSERPSMVTTQPDLVGFVTQVEPNRSRPGTGSLIIESHADKLVRRYRVRVTNDTRVFELVGVDHRPAGFDELSDLPGARHQVRVWTADGGAPRNASTTTAVQVVIVRTPEGN